MMSLHDTLWKGALCGALLPILFSCSPKCPQWETKKITSNCAFFNSGKIYYPSQDEFSGLEIEIAKGPSDTRLYLNVFALPLRGLLEDETKINVSITILDETFIVEADLLRGNQRVLLPNDTTRQILEALLHGQCVNIKVGQYKAEIPPQNLESLYFKLYN